MFQNVANGAIITHSGEAAAFFDDNIVEGGGGGASRGFSITQTSSGPLDLSVQRNTITSFEGEDTDGDGMLDPGEDLDGSSTLEFGVGIEVIVVLCCSVESVAYFYHDLGFVKSSLYFFTSV